ncbi:GGDEF domain-containing protein [Ahrensia kielensis]|uniref:GGDEF domain-containing protein n=1 Tax=Ahrensia kielensis TaxID=76980 RepID=UPI00036AA78B|nr:GGDEF domain-containing protein [Ahrensia kielensis]
MRLHKTEIVFLGYAALTATATYLIFLLKQYLDNRIDVGYADLSALSDINTMLLGALAIMICGLAIAMLGIYPALRSALKERGRLSEVTQDLTKKSATYQHAALTDPLTGLHNRRYFDDAIEQYLQEFGAIDYPLGVVLLDLDHFKNINDTYGHDVGDDVLRAIARCLLDYTRHHDVVARVGGEEFAILAPNLDVTALNKLANRIRVAISEITFKSGEACFQVTSSMGMTIWDGKEKAAALVKRADKNLYVAKTGGRDRVVS